MTPNINLQALYFPKRITDELENIKKYPLTVLEAPSGFGKTTLIGEFFSHTRFENANILKHTFFTDSTAEYWQWLTASALTDDRICAEALKNCGEPNRENMSDIYEIMKEIELPRETYIIFDNLSDSAENLDMFLSALECHGCKNLHFVVLIQSVNKKNGIRFHGSKTLLIGADELAFSKFDCLEYFACAGIVLTENELSELMHITGGWIFAVYLQLLFYAKNKRFEKGILNTLMKKAFFDRMNDKEQIFYISLSLFDSFTLSQAAAVSGCDAGFVYTHLTGNGFVHYDDKKQQYYFHHLLYVYLNEAFGSLSVQKQNRLLISAAEWEEKHGKKINAINLYYRAGDYERIFSIPHTSYDLADIENANTRKMIFDILENTPRDIKLSHIESMVPLAFILFFINEHEKLASVINEILNLLPLCNIPKEKRNTILGETELLISFTKYNDIAKMSSHHRKAYELSGKKASLINIQSTWTFGSPSVMFLYHKTAGELERELNLMDECMPYYYKLTDGHGSGSQYVMRAEADFMRGNLNRAETLAHRAIFEAQSKKQNSIVWCGFFVLANAALQTGDEAKLSDVLFSMSEISSYNTEDMCRYTFDLALGYIYAFTHRIKKIENWLLKGYIDENKIAPMTIPFANVIYAKILLERKEYNKLLAFCTFADENMIYPCAVAKIYFYIFICCAQSALSNEKEADLSLQTALSYALCDEIYMPFAQNLSYIKSSLKRITPFCGYDKILSLGDAFEKSCAKIALKKPELSPREKEVVSLIRQGLTNKQIAARLYISLSTVKIAIGNIFDKTGIKSRVQLSDTNL